MAPTSAARAALCLWPLIAIAQAWQIEFEKMQVVLAPQNDTTWRCPVQQFELAWEAKDVFNPAAIVKDGQVHLLYRAEDHIGRLAGTSRIGLGTSTDGLHFNRYPHPVLYPDEDEMKIYEWEGGIEDPRVVEAPDGTFVMTYTSYDGTARLCVATSSDLLQWKKHGPAFGTAFGGEFKNVWTKSGSIVVEPHPDGRLIAKKINGLFWMYWGEFHIHVATSEDLLDWTPLTEGNSEKYLGRPDHKDNPVNARSPLPVLSPRQGHFDSELVEPGPPALYIDEGILFIYNSKNKWCKSGNGHCGPGMNDRNLPPGTYSAGQALFDKTNPTKLLNRSSSTFFKPSEPFEITGQVGNVCFLEGLVYFNSNWLLYYGTADSKIAVAVAKGYDYKGRKVTEQPIFPLTGESLHHIHKAHVLQDRQQEMRNTV